VRPSDAAWRRAAAAVVALTVASGALAAPPAAAPSPQDVPVASAATLDALRQQCIAAARDVEQHEQAVPALAHTIDLLRRDAEARQRDLDESRPEQARLFAAIELFERRAPGNQAFFGETPLDRIRSRMLVDGTLPALQVEARALAAAIKRAGDLKGEIAAKEGELATLRETLASDRSHLAQLVALRLGLTRRLVAEDPAAAARFAKLGREAADLDELIDLADDEIDSRDKALLARARAGLPKAKAAALTAANADPTRPRELRVFDPPHSALVLPISAPITQRFAAAGADEPAGQGLRLAAPPGAEAVAPFDGRVVYAGPFRNRGVVLIIRHGGLYHTALVGLGRVDIAPGAWVLAGEPVGAMPDAADKVSGGPLYFELHHDGSPVDPQPWLTNPDEGRDSQIGDLKVRE
jgi:septal ring factor EnvC (AmiA/AmiB activator)